MALQHPLGAKHDRGVESRSLSKNELRALAPYFSDAVIGAGICPYEGKVNPILATPALARGADGACASFHRHTELRALARGGAAFKAATNRGTIGCRRVVIAAGAPHPFHGVAPCFLSVRVDDAGTRASQSRGLGRCD